MVRCKSERVTLEQLGSAILNYLQTVRDGEAGLVDGFGESVWRFENEFDAALAGVRVKHDREAEMVFIGVGIAASDKTGIRWYMKEIGCDEE